MDNDLVEYEVDERVIDLDWLFINGHIGIDEYEERLHVLLNSTETDKE